MSTKLSLGQAGKCGRIETSRSAAANGPGVIFENSILNRLSTPDCPQSW